MSKDVEPFRMPEWQALHRESSLVSQLIGAGATALGRASYGSGFGEYYTAFFGLSVGIERLCKLIIVADYAAENAGKLPPQTYVRQFGHKLHKLLEQVEAIRVRRAVQPPSLGPSHPICSAIVDCLEGFSDASVGRYANFDALSNPAFDEKKEPVNRWWREVVELILDKHFRGRKAEQGVKQRAAMIEALTGDYSYVLFNNEVGETMRDVTTASERTGQTKFAQKYGRYYTLCVVRWLSYIFADLSRNATYTQGADALFGHYEFFQTYTVTDDFLLNRKVWPLS